MSRMFGPHFPHIIRHISDDPAFWDIFCFLCHMSFVSSATMRRAAFLCAPEVTADSAPEAGLPGLPRHMSGVLSPKPVGTGPLHRDEIAVTELPGRDVCDVVGPGDARRGELLISLIFLLLPAPGICSVTTKSCSSI